jgi:hypothetical protein
MKGGPVMEQASHRGHHVNTKCIRYLDGAELNVDHAKPDPREVEPIPLLKQLVPRFVRWQNNLVLRSTRRWWGERGVVRW